MARILRRWAAAPWPKLLSVEVRSPSSIVGQARLFCETPTAQPSGFDLSTASWVELVQMASHSHYHELAEAEAARRLTLKEPPNIADIRQALQSLAAHKVQLHRSPKLSAAFTRGVLNGDLTDTDMTTVSTILVCWQRMQRYPRSTVVKALWMRYLRSFAMNPMDLKLRELSYVINAVATCQELPMVTDEHVQHLSSVCSTLVAEDKCPPNHVIFLLRTLSSSSSSISALMSFDTTPLFSYVARNADRPLTLSDTLKCLARLQELRRFTPEAAPVCDPDAQETIIEKLLQKADSMKPEEAIHALAQLTRIHAVIPLQKVQQLITMCKLGDPDCQSARVGELFHAALSLRKNPDMAMLVGKAAVAWLHVMPPSAVVADVCAALMCTRALHQDPAALGLDFEAIRAWLRDQLHAQTTTLRDLARLMIAFGYKVADAIGVPQYELRSALNQAPWEHMRHVELSALLHGVHRVHIHLPKHVPIMTHTLNKTMWCMGPAQLANAMMGAVHCRLHKNAAFNLPLLLTTIERNMGRTPAGVAQTIVNALSVIHQDLPHVHVPVKIVDKLMAKQQHVQWKHAAEKYFPTIPSMLNACTRLAYRPSSSMVERMLAAVVDINPPPSSLMQVLNWAALLRRAPRIGTAERLLDQLLADPPDCSKVHHMLASLAVAYGDDKMALSILKPKMLAVLDRCGLMEHVSHAQRWIVMAGRMAATYGVELPLAAIPVGESEHACRDLQLHAVVRRMCEGTGVRVEGDVWAVDNMVHVPMLLTTPLGRRVGIMGDRKKLGYCNEPDVWRTKPWMAHTLLEHDGVELLYTDAWSRLRTDRKGARASLHTMLVDAGVLKEGEGMLSEEEEGAVGDEEGAVGDEEEGAVGDEEEEEEGAVEDEEEGAVEDEEGAVGEEPLDSEAAERTGA